MAIKKNFGEKTFDGANAILMVFLIIIALYPLLYVAFASVSEPDLMITNTGFLFKPLGFTMASYQAVFKNPSIITGYGNTIFYAVVGTTLNLLMTSLAAYVLSRKGVLWRNPIMFIIVFTMFFSGGLIPSYLLIRNLGMFDSRLALILPEVISVYNFIIMKTSFDAIPDSLEESAKIDGANDFTVLFKIILPLSKPVIAVMVLFYAVGHWNSWLPAAIYLRDRGLYPLQLILREILIANDTNNMVSTSNNMDKEQISVTIKYATIMVATIPVLMIYPFAQKYFVKGVMIGAIKE